MKSSKLYIRKRSRFPKGLWAAFAVLLLAGGGAAWYFLLDPGARSAQAGASAQPLTTAVRRGSISVSASGSGKLAAGRTADLSFPTGGLVAELNVQLGDMVKQGDVLARLGSTEGLDAAVASAQVALLQAQQDLADLQTGASVSLAQAYQDQVTAQAAFDAALEAARRTAYARCSQDVLTREKAALDNAQARLDHVTRYEEGPQHSDAWINAGADYQTALANYSYCLAYTPAEKTGAQSELALAKSNLRQAQDTYDTLKAGSGVDPTQLALKEAALTAAQTALADAQQSRAGAAILAPFDGKVTSLASGVGTIAGTSTYITLADVNQPVVSFSANESDLDKLVLGSPAEVVFDALPDQTFTGTLTQVNPQLTASGQYNVVTGLVSLTMDPAQSLQGLPLGLNASLTIVNQESKDTLLVPETALIDLGNGSYGVMLAGSDGQLHAQPVKVGLQNGTDAEILSGLSEGDRVSAGISAGSASGNSQTGFPGGFGGEFGGSGFPLPPGQ